VGVVEVAALVDAALAVFPTLDILARFGSLKNRPSPATVFTNEFLPGAR